MQRDMDLVRRILIGLENGSVGPDPNNVPIDGYAQDQIGYHVFIMMEAGLVHGEMVASPGCGQLPQASPYSLTWNGHEFLDSAREESRWNQARQLLNKVGGASIQIWIAVLTDLVKRNLDLA